MVHVVSPKTFLTPADKYALMSPLKRELLCMLSARELGSMRAGAVLA